MEKQITCKVHDEDEVITHVGVAGVKQPMLEVWNEITKGINTFYTFENNVRANVYARERDGTKYLTTSPDGTTANNLDKLPDC